MPSSSRSVRRGHTPSPRILAVFPAAYRRRPLALLIALLTLSTALAPGLARAGCSTSSDGLTRTCTGDITSAQTFDHSDVGAVESYGFLFQALTSSQMATSSGPAIGFDSTGQSNANDHAGIGGSHQTLQFNLDGSVAGFSIRSSSAPVVQVQSNGRDGGGGAGHKGSGSRNGGDGGVGGVGGTLSLSFQQASIVASPGKAFFASSLGGYGGNGGEGHSTAGGDGRGGAGAAGGYGGEISIDLNAVGISNTNGGDATLLDAASRGGAGGSGGLGEAADTPAAAVSAVRAAPAVRSW